MSIYGLNVEQQQKKHTIIWYEYFSTKMVLFHSINIVFFKYRGAARLNHITPTCTDGNRSILTTGSLFINVLHSV